MHKAAQQLTAHSNTRSSVAHTKSQMCGCNNTKGKGDGRAARAHTYTRKKGREKGGGGGLACTDGLQHSLAATTLLLSYCLVCSTAARQLVTTCDSLDPTAMRMHAAPPHSSRKEPLVTWLTAWAAVCQHWTPASPPAARQEAGRRRCLCARLLPAPQAAAHGRPHQPRRRPCEE